MASEQDDADDTPPGFNEAPQRFGAYTRVDGAIDPAPPVSEFPRFAPSRGAGGPSRIGGGGPREGAKPHYWGHRQRVRDRFAAGGAESMPDYELVEMLLFNAVPKVDVKPLAKRLLEDFGGIERLLTASRGELLRHADVNEWIAHQFKLAEAIAVRLARSRISDRPLMGSTDAVIEYLRTRLAHSPIEHFRVLYLDTKHKLIADEEHGRGTVNHTPSYPREIVKRALELNTTGLILVHNHPSGDPTPSRQDVTMTNRIAAALGTVGIQLYDHLIIGKGAETSFAALGLIERGS